MGRGVWSMHSAGGGMGRGAATPPLGTPPWSPCAPGRSGPEGGPPGNKAEQTGSLKDKQASGPLATRRLPPGPAPCAGAGWAEAAGAAQPEAAA